MPQNTKENAMETNSAIAEGLIRCPMCHGEDKFCTLCDGEAIVTIDQHNEFRRQNPGAL